MRFKDFLLNEKVSFGTLKPMKNRPKKTLWFRDYSLWVHDIKYRYSDAEAYRLNTGDILALNDNNDKCYGRWNKKSNKGVTFNDPRPTYAIIQSTNKYYKIKD